MFFNNNMQMRHTRARARAHAHSMKPNIDPMYSKI